MDDPQLLNHQHGQFKNLNAIVQTSTTIDSENNADKRSVEVARLKAKARKTVRKNAWGFLSKNKDLLHRNTITGSPLDQFTNKQYKCISDVPSLAELYAAIKEKSEAKTEILSKRKMTFMEKSKRKSMTKVIHKQMRAQQAKLERLQQNALIMSPSDKEINQLIEITRTEPELRTDESCQILLDWMMNNCRKDSIVYTFLSNCDNKDGIQFCRGLQYQIFTQDEAIIRQGSLGYAYYITLTGECDIFVNKLLFNNEIADPDRKATRRGIGHYIATIKQGADFGEYALLSNAKRSATVIAKTLSVECLVCLQQHFKKSLAKHTEKETTKMVNNMKKTYLFRGAPKSYLRMLFNRFHRVTIESDTLLQQQKHSVETIYLLTKGKCREYIQIKDINGKSRKEFICEFREGDVVIGGYFGLLNKKPLSSIITCTPCECLTIDKNQFITSINGEMQNKLINVGAKKEIFVKQCIDKFQDVIKNIAVLFSKDTLEQEKQRQIGKWKGQYQQHGKWGEVDQESFDAIMSSNNLQATINKSVEKAEKTIQQTTKQSMQKMMKPVDQKQHHSVVEGSKTPRISAIPSSRKPPSKEVTSRSRYGMSQGEQRMTIPKTAEDITISVPSIEKFARKSSPKRKRRFAAKSPVIGGLFDYEYNDFSERMGSTEKHNGSQLKRPHTTQNTSISTTSQIEGEQENPFDLMDIKKGDQLQTRYMNDLMSSNFHSLSNLDITDENIYCQMIRSLKFKRVERRSKKEHKSSTNKKSRKLRTRKKRKTQRNASRMNRSATASRLPILKTRTQHKSTTSKAFGRSLSKQKVKIHDSRTQVKVTKDRNGRNNYEVNFGKYLKNVNLDITEWIKFNDVYRDFLQLQWRHKHHIIDQVEDARTRLSRTGSSPDLLMKYYAQNNPKLLEEYIKHFSKPTM